MPKLLYILSLTVLFSSCVQDNKDQTNEDPFIQNGDISLDNEIAQLKLDLAQKDSMINESLLFFNEIKSNLETISTRKDEIRAISLNNEIAVDDKAWVLEEIKHINYLREENANMMKRMKKQLSQNEIKMTQLEAMVDNLNKEIKWKDEQIVLLQSELNKLDQEYSALFDAYQEESMKVNELTAEMNSVYYAYGTADELSDNGVVQKKNGFIGLGKKISLKDDINDAYFTKVDASSTKKISIQGDKVRFITNHPTDSYELSQNGSTTVINILKPANFWKISKYLVVIVE